MNRLLQSPVQLILGFFWDISRRRSDLSLCRREKSRFLPLYYSYSRLVREARGIRCHTLIEHQARCRRRPPPPLSSLTAAAVVNGSYSSWQCCRGLPHGGGKACQYFWRPGSSSKEAFVWGVARLTRTLSLPPSSATPLPSLRGEDTISAIFVLPTNGDSHRHRSAGGDAMSAARARLRAARACEHVSHESL
jgi:hypothetical protein